MLRFAYPISVVAEGGAGKHLKTQLNGAFDFSDVDGKCLHMDAEKDRWEDLVALMALRYDKIERASVSTVSVLRVEQ